MITEIKSIMTTQQLYHLNDKKNDILKSAWELKETLSMLAIQYCSHIASVVQRHVRI
jgi:hypothetical protein